MRRRLSTIVLVFIMVLGLCILAYPSFSDWWNSSRQTKAIETYTHDVETVDSATRQRLWNRAQEYNAELAQNGNTWVLTNAQWSAYEDQLRLSDTDVMCYVEVPAIRCMLPVYHSTAEEVLQTGVGHIEGSSLPIGGESTHCVLSGHRGLPSAQLFTRLDKLIKGDRFMLHTLGVTLTYEVDQIRVVEPDKLDDLVIVPDEDLCTLVTCTPYGINTHRLLVRGHRVYPASVPSIMSDASQVDSRLVALCLAVPLMVLLFIVAMVTGTGRRNPVEEMPLPADAELSDDADSASNSQEAAPIFQMFDEIVSAPEEAAVIPKSMDTQEEIVYAVYDSEGNLIGGTEAYVNVSEGKQSEELESGQAKQKQLAPFRKIGKALRTAATVTAVGGSVVLAAKRLRYWRGPKKQ